MGDRRAAAVRTPAVEPISRDTPAAAPAIPGVPKTVAQMTDEEVLATVPPQFYGEVQLHRGIPF